MKEEADERSKARQELQREAVRQQMTLDESTRQHIKKVKDTERAQAMLDLENWKQTQKPKPKPKPKPKKGHLYYYLFILLHHSFETIIKHNFFYILVNFFFT